MIKKMYLLIKLLLKLLKIFVCIKLPLFDSFEIKSNPKQYALKTQPY